MKPLRITDALTPAPLPPTGERTTTAQKWSGVLRQPLLHFLLLGSLLFLGQDLLPRPAETIPISAADIERLRQDWTRDTGRLPTPAQLRVSVDRWLEDEALLREARRRGLDHSDAVARRRLLMNLRFAYPETALDDAALLREAELLEMQHSDLVARRRLVQAMEQQLLVEIEWSAEELDAYIAAHPQRYAAQLRYSFRQAYLAPSRSADEAAQMLAALQAQPAPERLPGDAFLLGERFNALTETEIARQFGPSLAQAIASAAPGEWIGPLASPYGLHLLQLERRERAADGTLAAQRRAAAYALLAEREVQWLAQARAELRQRYRVEAGPGVSPELAW